MITKLLDGATATHTGTPLHLPGDRTIIKVPQTVQATVAGSGSVSATVIVEFSNDLVGWIPGFTIPLSGTDIASNGDLNNNPWSYARARLTEISGIQAAVTVSVGV